MPNTLLDSQLDTLLAQDRRFIESTEFPIVTVSSSFREDLKQFYGMEHDPNMRDVVFSRAHFSMAFAMAVEAWLPQKDRQHLEKYIAPQPNAKRAWFIDPTNYVQSKDWSKIQTIEYIGRKLARNSFLKWVKDRIDTFARNRLPITTAITPPLLHLFQHVHRPIISLHYEVGNILAGVGKHVVQVVTDPHVRDQYLDHADLPNIKFCVFDEKTKSDFLEKAALFGKHVDEKRVIVTGPPVCPRVVGARKKKSIHDLRRRPLRICITTGGLGTNKEEVRKILSELLDLVRKRPEPIHILCYAGTQHDFTLMIQDIAKKEHITIEPLENENAKFRLIHGKHIVELNEQLIQYAFPWADVFITKPSGDMAYDAAAAGCSLLFLTPWGEWEKNIQEVFEQQGVGRKAEIEHIKTQVNVLSVRALHNNESWFEHAKEKALNLPALFLHGSENILNIAKEWK
ncbi:MAG TPA: hypothetical protein DCX25_03455 [Candidatus Pacebacteria bacterium]|nr:hypothetical protein [Candidatus Paceibacterota bacterium]HCR11367.1 hypothetical protein [Candidatus Paceibacterota bacterium]